MERYRYMKLQTLMEMIVTFPSGTFHVAAAVRVFFKLYVSKSVNLSMNSTSTTEYVNLNDDEVNDFETAEFMETVASNFIKESDIAVIKMMKSMILKLQSSWKL